VVKLREFAKPAVSVPLALFALALLLRLIGVDWHGHHNDEDLGGPARVLSGDFHPRSYYYPPLLTYLVAVADVLLFALGWLLAWWHSASEFRAAYFTDWTPFFVTARTAVAICSATAAPIAWALARQVRLSRNAAVMAGLAAALLPGAIYWAHIAKSDSALGPAYLLCVLCALRMAERPSSLARPVQLGIAIALAVSFKQSAVFFLFPAFAFFAPWSLYNAAERRPLIRSWVVATTAAAIAIAILNLAIIVDPKPFVQAQEVQSQMSFRAASFDETLRIWRQQLVSPNNGLPVITLMGAVGLWGLGVARSRPSARLLLVLLGIGWIGATVIILALVGARQPLQLWLPNLVVGFVAAAIAAGILVDSTNRILRPVGYGGFGLLVVSAVIRIVPILDQATAPPMQASVAAVIRGTVPPAGKIVSNVDFSSYLPLSRESQTWPRARHERLAKIYGVKLPPPDRPFTGVANGYTIVDFPWVIGGLEAFSADQVKVVVPYAWPLQPEEWDLSWWLGQGFHVFVVSDEAGLKNDPVPAYRRFFRSLDRCSLLKRLPPRRPLFAERETSIYQCD